MRRHPGRIRLGSEGDTTPSPMAAAQMGARAAWAADAGSAREDCTPGFFLQMRKTQPGGVSPLPLLTWLDGSSSDLGPKVWIPEPTHGSEHRVLGDVRGDAEGKQLHLSRSSEGGKNVLSLTHSQLNRKRGTMRGRGGCDGAFQAEEGPTSLQR